MGQMGARLAFWTCRETAASAAHAHDYDEYMIVVQGCYTLIIDGERIPLKAGQEYFIPRGAQKLQNSSLAKAPCGPAIPTLPRCRGGKPERQGEVHQARRGSQNVCIEDRPADRRLVAPPFVVREKLDGGYLVWRITALPGLRVSSFR